MHPAMQPAVNLQDKIWLVRLRRFAELQPLRKNFSLVLASAEIARTTLSCNYNK